MRTVPASGAAMPALAQALIGWTLLCLGVGLSITLAGLVESSAALGPVAVRATQAAITAAVVIPSIMILRRRLGEDSRPSKHRLPLTWMRPAAIGASVGLGTATVTWLPAVWVGWIRVESISVPQLLIFLAVNTLIALLYEALPEELALRGYAWESLRQCFRPISAAAGVTTLFCLTNIGISTVQTVSALLLGVRADGITLSPGGTDPVAYFVQISLFGLALIAARSLPTPGALAAAVAFHLVHLTVNRLLFGGLGGFDTGVEASVVVPDAVVLVLVHIILSGLVFAVLRKVIPRRSGALGHDPRSAEYLDGHA